MMRKHCDICGVEVLHDRDHIWPNQLPAGHRLRNVSAQIRFSDAKHEVDLCERCFSDWLRGLSLEPAAEGDNQ